MMPLAILLCVALTFQSGCADLIVREYDSAEMVTGKVASRVLLGITTIGISELGISQIKQQEAREAQRRALKDNWDSAIGRYTFHDAVQQFGPPSTVLNRSYDFTAVWESTPGPTLYVPGPSVGYGSFWVGVQVPTGRIQLRFDRKSDVLIDWRVR